jgi:hypothetical protein
METTQNWYEINLFELIGLADPGCRILGARQNLLGHQCHVNKSGDNGKYRGPRQKYDATKVTVSPMILQITIVTVFTRNVRNNFISSKFPFPMKRDRLHQATVAKTVRYV